MFFNLILKESWCGVNILGENTLDSSKNVGSSPAANCANLINKKEVGYGTVE